MTTRPLVGLYGPPGSGKTHHIDELMRRLPGNGIRCYDLPVMAPSLVPGDVKVYDKMGTAEKMHVHQRAVKQAATNCIIGGKFGIITGNFLTWPEGKPKGERACSDSEISALSCLLYLNVDTKTLQSNISKDKMKKRGFISSTHLNRWQNAEKEELAPLCAQLGVAMAIVPQQFSTDWMIRVLHALRRSSEPDNLVRVFRQLDGMIKSMSADHRPDTMMIFEGDRTVTPADTGSTFWRLHASQGPDQAQPDRPLQQIFDGPLGDSFAAFRQTSLLYEQSMGEASFRETCENVARETRLRDSFCNMFRLLPESPKVGAIIITSGLREVWQNLVGRSNLFDPVPVIGGGRLTDGVATIVDAATKAAIVERLQTVHGMRVWAFGDSPLDVAMLRQADHAIVLVGDDKNRSEAMRRALLPAIDQDGLKAEQVLMTKYATPLLEAAKLPCTDLTAVGCIKTVLQAGQPPPPEQFRFIHESEKGYAREVSSQMSDASLTGSALRTVHQKAGKYLAPHSSWRSSGLRGSRFEPTRVDQRRDRDSSMSGRPLSLH